MLRSSGARRQSIAVMKTFGAFFVLLVGALFTLFAIHQYRSEQSDPASIEAQLHALGTQWSADLADSQRTYREWLSEHGTRTESRLFDDISSTLLQSVLSIAASDAEEGKLSFLSSLYVALHSGLIRVTFILLASLRLWIVVVGVSIFLGVRGFKAYISGDLLGQSGNGRMFYSGVRVGLDSIGNDGAPDILLRGLACPESAPLGETHASPLWATLGEFNAQNKTNEALVSILVKYAGTHPFVALADEEVMLRDAFSGDNLAEHTEGVLRAALTLQGLYGAGEYKSDDVLAPSSSRKEKRSGARTSAEYTEEVKTAFHRVLRPELRQIIGALPPADLSTMILAYECGKVLSYSFEGGKWVRRSNFPHLSGRAVLHSVQAYPEEYDALSRNRIRRALVYASRHSAFAPVRMPIDMDEDTWALRQWCEVLTALPHQLEATTDEVELVGLVRAAHNNWLQEFLDGAVAFKPEIAKNSFSTPSNLMFVPILRLVELLRKTLSEREVRRLESLVAVVSTRQRLQTLEAQNLEGGGPEGPAVERVYSPLTDEEVAELTRVHQIPEDQLRDWSAFRIVLTSYGWLARRVGDYTVPESSVIFSVFRAEGVHEETNSYGFIGRKGMVPLRGTRLEDRWGKNWANRFTLVNSAIMAETAEDYEKLLKGIDDRAEDLEPEGASAIA